MIFGSINPYISVWYNSSRQSSSHTVPQEIYLYIYICKPAVQWGLFSRVHCALWLSNLVCTFYFHKSAGFAKGKPPQWAPANLPLHALVQWWETKTGPFYARWLYRKTWCIFEPDLVWTSHFSAALTGTEIVCLLYSTRRMRQTHHRADAVSREWEVLLTEAGGVRDKHTTDTNQQMLKCCSL